MKKALILHGWGANPKIEWFQKEKAELEKMGYRVSAPALPNVYSPKEKAWVKYVKDFEPDENSVLIGHSLGGTTILEYLENTNSKVGTVVLISAPVDFKANVTENPGLFMESFATEIFLESCDYEGIKEWDKVKNSARKFVLIYKTDDVRAPEEEGKFVAQKLEGELTILESSQHGPHDIDFNLINSKL